MANYLEKADSLIASLYVDQDLFLGYWAPFVIRFYATFRLAYFENPNFPPSVGLKRLAIKALGYYTSQHVGLPEPQFEELDFGS
jgi:hypothetical protein